MMVVLLLALLLLLDLNDDDVNLGTDGCCRDGALADEFVDALFDEAAAATGLPPLLNDITGVGLLDVDADVLLLLLLLLFCGVVATGAVAAAGVSSFECDVDDVGVPMFLCKFPVTGVDATLDGATFLLMLLLFTVADAVTAALLPTSCDHAAFTGAVAAGVDA